MSELVIGEAFEQEFNRIRDKVDGTTGPEVNNSSHSITHTPRQPGEDGRGWPPSVEIKITANITISSANAVGRYNGKLFTGFSNNNPTNLVESDLGKLSTNLIEVWNIGEINGGGGALSVNQIVPGILKGYNSVTSQPIYHCTPSLPTGQYQYMNYQMVSQNQAGWDFSRAHPLI